MSPRGLRAWCHALPRMRASSLPASPLPVCSRMGRASRPRRASPGVIGALCRGRKRGNAVKGTWNTEAAQLRDMPRKPLDGWSATLPARETAARFPLPHGECGVGAEGQRPHPRLVFGDAARPPFFSKKGEEGWGTGAATGRGNAPGKEESRPDAQHALACGCPPQSTRLYKVKGSVLPFISKEAIV